MALTDKLSAIAEAIRSKTGKTDPMTLDEMPTEIAGIETGGGSDNSEIEEMLLATDENYDDEGKQFYSPYKWISVNHSDFSVCPFSYIVTNNHPTLWLHVYVYAETYTPEQGIYRQYNYTLTIDPDQGEDVIEIEDPIANIHIEGIRWSTDGV